MTLRAEWNGAVLAESDDTVEVDGAHYFRAEDVAMAHLEPSEHTSRCGWKGTATYWDVVVDGERNPDAAWCYAEPMEAASMVDGRIAFWHGVAVGPADG